MKLSEYINKFYDGNISHFADDNSYYRQNVRPMLKKGFYHVIRIDSKLMCIMAKSQLRVDKLKDEEL